MSDTYDEEWEGYGVSMRDFRAVRNGAAFEHRSQLFALYAIWAAPRCDEQGVPEPSCLSYLVMLREEGPSEPSEPERRYFRASVGRGIAVSALAGVLLAQERFGEDVLMRRTMEGK